MLFGVFGLVALRSRTLTRLQVKPFTRLRRSLELVALGVLITIPILVTLQYNEFVGPFTDPITFIGVPVALLIGYLFIPPKVAQ
jgi:hypothetical protein